MNSAAVFALNEVEATAKKAARGAGYTWGMAEEASKATRWLCANGIDGAKALATILTKADDIGPGEMAPADISGDWAAKAGAMCPLMAGAVLSDFAGIGTANEVTMLRVVAPVMLLPFAAMAARQLDQPVAVEWDGVRAVTTRNSLSLEGLKGASFVKTTTTIARVTIRVGAQIGQPMPQHTRATPDAADWATLTQFAHRTYAPATESSRLMGAGAGLSDND